MAPPPEHGGGAAGEGGAARQKLLEVLGRARPMWTERDRGIAESKLAKVGIRSVDALADALRGPLNARLRAVGLQTFTGETLRALRALLGVSRPEAPAASATAAAVAAVARPAAPTAEGAEAAARGRRRLRPSDLVAGSWLAEGDGAVAFDLRRDEEGERRCSVCDAADRSFLASSSAAPASAPDEEECTCRFRFWQRIPGGGALQGSLERDAGGGQWMWEVDLERRGRLQLRREGSELATRYRGGSDQASWSSPRAAKRPQLYAFYSSHLHPSGYRYAHLGHGAAGGEFPIVGLTAGWLPAEVVQPADAERLRRASCSEVVRVRFLGTFCDAFDLAPSPPVASGVRVGPPQPVRHAAGQVLLAGGGAVIVHPSQVGPPGYARSPFAGRPFQRPPPPSLGGRPPFAPPFGQFGPKGGGKGFSAKGGPPGAGGPPSSSSGFPKGYPPRFGGAGAPPPVDALSLVASAFRTTRQALRDHAIFRGKLRPLPSKRCHESVELNLPASSIRCASGSADGGADWALPAPRPLLSLLVLRWYDYWSDPERCSDYSTLNDGYFVDLLDGPCSVGKLLPGEYEIYTIFIRRSGDLRRLHPQQLRSLLRGRNIAAWYFVWPSTSPSDGDGYVSERDFFALVRGMEREGIRTCWPHTSTLYRELCGKLWIPQMCLSKEHRVPPTTRVHYADFAANGRRTAIAALRALLKLRKTLWGHEDLVEAEFKGVVKLGFSWCGCDVMPFQGISSLVTNLQKLFGSSASESTVCLVQEMIPGVVGEHRIVCFYDMAAARFRKEPVWMESTRPATALHKYNMQSMDLTDFKVAGSVSMSPSAVASRYFRGDSAAQRDAEQEAMRLADLWLSWFETQAPEPPQCTRLDFLVAHRGEGKAEVWTCEVGECGASLCSIEVHGRNLAALNSAIACDPTGRFPMPLPAELPRNNGSKS